jgi:hypothetical protein
MKNHLASALVLAYRSWQALAGVVTLLLIARFLSPEQQGYYYTLAALAAMHMALDMGLTSILVQFSAREFVSLQWAPQGGVQGAAPERFLSIAKAALRWFFIAGCLFLLCYPVGVAYVQHGGRYTAVDWQEPWMLLVVATAVGLFSLPVLAIGEGSGDLIEVYTLRLLQGVLASAATWFALLQGMGLYVLAIAPCIVAGSNLLWIVLRKRGFLLQLLHFKAQRPVWLEEVWPLQWRLGVAFLSGYVLVLMHAPLLFRTHGPVLAGRMGLTMTVASMLSMLALSWSVARIPTMARLASGGNWRELDQVFWRVVRWSMATYSVGALGFLTVLWLVQLTQFAERFLSLPQVMGLLLAMGCYHVNALFAVYIRAHMKEPFLLLSLGGTVCTLLGCLWVAPHWGASGVIAVLFCANACLFMPATLSIWGKLRHQQKAFQL